MTVPYRRKSMVEHRREDLHRIDAMTVKVSRVNGRVLIIHQNVAAAESTVEIPFPVVFVEKPIFTYGSALGENYWPLAGSFPTMSATVVGWSFIDQVAGVTEGRFTGATVATVTTGLPDQQIWLNYSFEGKAMRNPLNSLGEIGEL